MQIRMHLTHRPPLDEAEREPENKRTARASKLISGAFKCATPGILAHSTPIQRGPPIGPGRGLASASAMATGVSAEGSPGPGHGAETRAGAFAAETTQATPRVAKMAPPKLALSGDTPRRVGLRSA